jgi:hypothetical protein
MASRLQVGNAGAATFIAAWNLISVVFEYLLLVYIYKQFPALAEKKKTRGQYYKTFYGSNLRIFEIS